MHTYMGTGITALNKRDKNIQSQERTLKLYISFLNVCTWGIPQVCSEGEVSQEEPCMILNLHDITSYIQTLRVIFIQLATRGRTINIPQYWLLWVKVIWPAVGARRYPLLSPWTQEINLPGEMCPPCTWKTPLITRVYSEPNSLGNQILLPVF